MPDGWLTHWVHRLACVLLACNFDQPHLCINYVVKVYPKGRTWIQSSGSLRSLTSNWIAIARSLTSSSLVSFVEYARPLGSSAFMSLSTAVCANVGRDHCSRAELGCDEIQSNMLSQALLSAHLLSVACRQARVYDGH